MSRILFATTFGLIGAAIGTTIGVAGSVLGFFFGAVAGTLVFGTCGAAIGWFAARDIEDQLAAFDAKHPAVKSRLICSLQSIWRGAYLAPGLVLILLGKIIGLFRKKNA